MAARSDPGSVQTHRQWQWVRHLLARRLPHGLLGPGYLWPGGDERVRLHRRLWWDSGRRWPRPAWLFVEAWLWLRWQAWHALPACWRGLRRLGPAVEAEEGIPRRTQGWRLLRLALLWCIPPSDGYRFRLYRDPRQALDFIYDTETHSYHAWRSQGLGLSPASRHLLQDKAHFAAMLNDQGISVVPALARGVRTSNDMAPLLEGLRGAGRVFCKENSGNQGRGAFTAWTTAAGLEGRAFTGQPLVDTQAVSTAWRELLKCDDALVQPCLENHPALAPLAYNEDAITVRFISQWQEEGPGRAPERLSCLHAVLEVPAGRGAAGHIYYAILPIRAETGELGGPIRPMALEPAMREAIAKVSLRAASIPALPGWGSLAEGSFRAHRLFPDVRAIAWDWVLTPAGPVLLEGNVGWGLAVPQVFRGTGALRWAGSKNCSSL